MNGSGEKSGIFLSYNSLDRAEVDRVASYLKGRDVTVFQDHSSMKTGDDWPTRLQEALMGCRAIVVFFGPNGLGPWQKREKGLALLRIDRDSDFIIVPVLLPGLGEPPLDPVMLYVWVDLRSGVSDARLEDLTRTLKSTSRIGTAHLEICPFRGLEYFREEDSDFFFGRSAVTDSLKKKLEDHALVAVVGPSGCGKSSVVRAGLIPALRESNLAWQVITLRPGNQPFHALAATLIPLLCPTMTVVDRLREIGKLERDLATGDTKFRDAAEEVLRIQNGPQRLLVVIDQWEELYSQTETQQARNFIEQILGITTSAESRVRAVITLRGDFFGHALTYPPLAEKIRDGLVTLSTITQAELEQTITGPAERAGLKFEPGLVNRILEEVTDEPGKLPLLQFLLSQLWNGRRNGVLTHAEYEKVGKVRGAISTRAEEIFTKLSPDEQKAAKQIFIQLVRLEHEDATTRRRAQFAQFPAPMQALIGKFVAARLLVTQGAETAGSETLEIAHEALIDHWSRLQDWVAEEKEFLRWRRRLGNAIETYNAATQKKYYFLHDESLTEAELWLQRGRSLDKEEIQFIKASLDYRDRGRRIAITISTAISAFAIGWALLTWWEWRQAESRKRLALSRQLTAQSHALRNTSNGNLRFAALLAIESLRMTPSAEADQALRAAMKLLPIYVTNFLYDDEVRAVAYSPTGEFLVTASSNTATIRSATNGELLGKSATHDRTVTFVIFSHDGKMFATASDDKTAKVWETVTGRNLATITNQGIVNGIAFDPEDKYLATASSDGIAGLFSVADGHPKFEVRRDAASVTALSLSSDGHYLATGTAVGMVKIINASNGGPTKETKVNTNATPVTALSFSPNNALLAIGSADGTVEVLDTTNWNSVFNFPFEPGIHLSFSPDGSRLAIAAGDTARILDAGQWLRIGNPMRHGGAIRAMVFNPGGGLLATASEDKTARVWDLVDEVHPEIVRVNHSNIVHAVAFKPDGQCLATASADRTVMIWGTNGYWEAARTRASTPLQAIAFSPNGQRFATADSGGTERLWKTVTTKEITNRNCQAGLGSTLSFNSDGSLLAAGSDRELCIWNLNSYQAQPCPPFDSKIVGFAFSIYSNCLAVACENGSAFRIESSNDKPFPLLKPDKTIACAAFSRDLNYLLAGCATSNAWLWNLSTTQSYRLPHAAGVSAVCFSPDGRLMATSSYDRILRIWDVEKRKLLTRFDDAGISLAITFSPESTYLAAAPSGKVRIWNCNTGQEIARMEHNNDIAGLAFSPNGRFLATACADGCARLWIWESERLIEIARTRLTEVSTELRQQISSGNFNSF